MIYAGLLIVIAVVVYLMRKKKPAEQPKQENRNSMKVRRPYRQR